MGQGRWIGKTQTRISPPKNYTENVCVQSANQSLDKTYKLKIALNCAHVFFFLAFFFCHDHLIPNILFLTILETKSFSYHNLWFTSQSRFHSVQLRVFSSLLFKFSHLYLIFFLDPDYSCNALDVIFAHTYFFAYHKLKEKGVAGNY